MRRLARRWLSTRRPPLPHYQAPALGRVEAHSPDGEPLHYSLSCTGPGPMANWMYGFSDALRTSDLWSAGSSTVTGVSGGAIGAVCIATGVDLSPSATFQSELRSALRQCGGNTSDAIRRALDVALPDDVARRVSGRARVALVRADGQPWRSRKPTLVELYEDKEDVIGAVCASAHLPYLMNGKPTATWRGEEYLDAAVFGYGIIHVEGAVHVSTCPPAGFTPPGQAGPVLDPVRWFLHGRETAPSDAHPWLSGDEELRELPTGSLSQVCDLLGVMQRKGAAQARYRMGREAFGLWARREMALRL